GGNGLAADPLGLVEPARLVGGKGACRQRLRIGFIGHQTGLRRRNLRTPPASSPACSSSHPVVRQKCSKSLVAPGSVASTSRTPPAGTAFNARRAFSTGSGHKRPVASSVVVASAGSAIARLPKPPLAAF